MDVGLSLPLQGELIDLEDAGALGGRGDDDTPTLQLVFDAVECPDRLQRLGHGHILQVEGQAAGDVRVHQDAIRCAADHAQEHFARRGIVDIQVEARLRQIGRGGGHRRSGGLQHGLLNGWGQRAWGRARLQGLA